MRRRTVIALVLVALAVGGAVGGYLGSQRHVGRLLARGDRVNVLLLGIDDNDQDRCTAVAIVSLSPGDAVSALVVPHSLRLRLSDGSIAPIAEAHATSGAEAVREALAAFLRVDLPFYIEVDHDVLRRGAEAFGAPQVTVHEPLPCGDVNATEGASLELPPGQHSIDADAIPAYMRCAARAEGETGGRMLQEMIAAILRPGMVPNLADDRARAAARTLYPLLRTNLSIVDLYDLTTMAGRIEPSRLQLGVVPAAVTEIDGALYAEPVVVETARLAARLLRGEDFLAPADVRVAVFNGNGERDLAKRVGAFLAERSFPVVHTGNAESFGYERTYVVHFGDGDKARLVADSLPGEAAILPSTRFSEHLEALTPHIPSGTDVVVVVGAGFEVGDG